jgi:hypothetical protein
MAGTFPSRDVWRRPKLFEYDSESGQLILGSDPARVGV